ncbi:amidohydrolase [Thermomicrobium sp. 4228-Ro]|uniref:amidohydrolase n=1 Tax=Thermomicrobium sp. 4228-Ro TaxID=2993937 RepID=UPI0022497A4F|nr:amidohydrolase [Thermomicrobium sp. 4228-Ro]MCX2726474.1 amidohydrolase [Thermomicrobium sp. 4228-Ro]
MEATLALFGGHVVTAGATTPPATAIALAGDRILAVGSDADVRRFVGPRTETIDLRGRTVTPGFDDAHCHPIALGLSLREVDARTPPNRSVADIIARIAERAATQPPGTWIVARGYDQAQLAERRHPTREDLDRATSQHPVLLIRACGHIGVANSMALARAGIGPGTPDPPGGTIDRATDGTPTGVLREAALQRVRAILPEPTVADLAAALEEAGSLFLRYGVTSVQEAGIRRAEEFQAYQILTRDRRLPVRSTLMILIDPLLETVRALGIRTGFGDSWLRIGPAKLFLDGSIGGRTARMSQPYLDRDTLGLWMDDPETMKRKIVAAHCAGFQCCAHAIGDAAIELLLDSFEEALRLQPRHDHRHRIEHCSILRPDLIDRIARLGAVPIPGTTFLHDFREVYLSGLGSERLRYAYALRTFLDRGILAAASSDAPVCSPNPMLGIQTMITRKDASGQATWPEECISLEEAIRVYTLHGAYASFSEHEKGTLEPGKLADLVVLETDLRTVPPDALAQVRVDYTIVDGRVAYARPGAP